MGRPKQVPLPSIAHAESVDSGVEYLVFIGEHFRSAEDDAVDDDERQIDAERRVERGSERLDEHLHHRDEARDQNDIAGDAHLVGNDLAQRGDDDVRAEQDSRRRKTHAEGVPDAGGGGEGRAGAENEHQHGVFLDDALGEVLQSVQLSRLLYLIVCGERIGDRLLVGGGGDGRTRDGVDVLTFRRVLSRVVIAVAARVVHDL